MPGSEAGPARSGDRGPVEGRMRLRLYIIGTAPASNRAITNTRRLCEQHLDGRYDLEVIDIQANPADARAAQIVAAPTLIKLLPPPVRRFIGDMSRGERILARLDLPAMKPI